MPKTEERAGAAGRGDADVVDLLQAQHREVKSLFERLLSVPVSERQDVFDELRRLLAVHETAEEIIVHPALSNLGDDGERVAEARIEEESQAKHDLAALEDFDVDHPEFMTLVVALRGAVVHHADMEEQTEHVRLRERVPADRLRSMATAVRAAEAAAPTHPHPHGPDGAVGNLIVGPFASIADRVRDAISNVKS